MTKGKAVLDKLGALAALLLLCCCMVFLSPSFLSARNLFNILMQISTIAVISVGMTYVILIGAIDLSVGSIVAFTALVMAVLMKSGLPVPLAIASGVLLGAAIGWINGALVALVGLPPFIATLGMMSIARGAAFTITGGQPVYTFSAGFTGIAERIGPVPVPVIIMLSLFLIAGYVLGNTRFGRYVYAIGGNETASKLSGIAVKAHKQIVFVISGATCAVAATILTARLDSAVPVAGDGVELDAIAAVIIGGTSMNGGQGTVSGTLIGALIMGVVGNGLNLLVVPQGTQRIVKGLIIIVAVIIDLLRKRKER